MTRFLTGLILMMSLATSHADPLTLERIYASPSLNGATLSKPQLSPDGKRATFLRGKQDDRNQMDLWQYEIDSGQLSLLVDSKVLLPEEGELSDEEKARRERQRISGQRGIVEYAFSRDGQALLFPLGGNLYHYDLGKPEAEAVSQLTRSEAFDTDPQFSPRGNHVAFIRDQDLYVVDVRTAVETRLTDDGQGVIKNGMAEFVAQEEMDRDTGYWWSPDESMLAYLRVDETPVSVTRRYEIHADEFRVVEQRYPYTGENNVTLKLGVVARTGGKTRWIDTGREQDIYLPRVQWLPDSKRLSWQLQSRDQKSLTLNITDLDDLSTRSVLTETSKTWVNLNSDLHFLTQQPALVWASERDGFKHLYLYGVDGTLIRRLTEGPWQVDEVEGVDEAGNTIYFTATAHSVLEQHLFRQALDTRSPETVERITRREGFHDITMNEAAQIYIDQYSSPSQPPQTSLHRADGSRLTWLLENALDEDHPYHAHLDQHQPYRFGTLEAGDGQTLQYRMLTPPDFDAGKQYPVMIYVYGGPGVQVVNKQWSRHSLFQQYMAQQGIIVYSLDNRGSKRRGTAFENPLFERMGSVEVDDQMVGVRYLKSLPYVNPDRIGIFGWSYGGYMTLMALMQHPDAFAAGVSVAPVTDWRLYDTHYTERYMSRPQLNSEGYHNSNVLTHARRLSSPLLLIHGMADDNVLFEHTTRLYKTLQDEVILFDTMAYPGGKHRLAGQATQTHVFGLIAAYFNTHLKD